MNRKMLLTALLIAATAGASFGAGKGPVHSIDLPVIQVELKEGEGKGKVATLCNICHSTDYITMQPPFSKAQWAATVNKMIKVLGAPINEEDAKVITEYLSKNYGTGK